MNEATGSGQGKGFLAKLWQHVMLFVATGGWFAADQWTKHLAASRFGEHMVSLLDTPKFTLRLTLAHNPAGAWSMFGWAPGIPRRILFIAVSVIASALLSVWYARTPHSHRLLRLGICFVLGGALGNLVDRVLTGQVIDFVEMSVMWGGSRHYWPTYNIADIAICIGVGFLALDMLRPHKQDARA
jgi:signal peptidase II